MFPKRNSSLYGASYMLCRKSEDHKVRILQGFFVGLAEMVVALELYTCLFLCGRQTFNFVGLGNFGTVEEPEDSFIYVQDDDYKDTNNNVNIENEVQIISDQKESLSLIQTEKDFICKALEKHKGKRKDAAKELGISERTLYRKINEYQIKL